MRMYGINNTAAAKSGAEQTEEAERAGECVGLEGKLLSCLCGVGEYGSLYNSFSSPGLSDWRPAGGKQRPSGGKHAKKETSQGGADKPIPSRGGADMDEPISSQGRGRADEPIPVEYLVVARLLNGEKTPAHTGSELRSNPRGLRGNVGTRRGERLQKGQLVELLCQHLEDRKQLEKAGLRDVYTENNSIRLGNTAFVELFGVQERKPYTGKYDIMEARAGSVKFYTMIPRSER